MTIRFQADADLRRAIVLGVRRREPAIDFRDAHEAGLRGLNDEQVLELAAKEIEFSCPMTRGQCRTISLGSSPQGQVPAS